MTRDDKSKLMTAESGQNWLPNDCQNGRQVLIAKEIYFDV